MIEPQSLHDGASCWYRNVAVLRVFGPSASFGAAMIGEVPREETKETSAFVRGAMLGMTGTASSRTITPACVWLSRSRNFVASHLKM